MAKIGRNDACPCGSGKKYKKCCLKRAIDYEGNFANIMKDRYPDISDNFIQGGVNDIKMSEIIIDFAEELLDKTDSIEEKHAAIGLSIYAWNLSLLDEDTCNQQLLALPKNKEMKKYKNAHKEILTLLKFLIDKKLLEYHAINRFILDYEFIETHEDEFHLNIASVIPKEELESTIGV